MLSHLQLLPPLYLPHALLLDPSAQLVLPTLLAGLEHVNFSKVSSLSMLLKSSSPVTFCYPLFSVKISHLHHQFVQEIKEQVKYPYEDVLPVPSTPKLLKRVRSSFTRGRNSAAQSTCSTPAHNQAGAQFILNIPQSRFPSLQPSTSSSFATSHHQYSSLHHPVGALSHDVPIEACAEATEALNEQVCNFIIHVFPIFFSKFLALMLLFAIYLFHISPLVFNSLASGNSLQYVHFSSSIAISLHHF